MSIPAKPHIQHQGPACHCVIDGECLGWLSCTAYAFALGIDKSTLGAKRPTGCEVRGEISPKDITGGTKLTQCAAAARSGWGVHFDVFSGSGVCTPAYGGKQLKAGRGFVLQGNTGPLLKTVHKSTNGPVNHAVWVNDGMDWDGNTPESVTVYDVAADGRRDMASAPDRWSWDLLLDFAAALEPNGEGTGHLGHGRWYAAFGPSTEPHVHIKFHGVKTTPFPDRTRAKAPKGRRVNVHSSPTKSKDTVIATLADGDLFVAYQRAVGDTYAGSSTWYGNHDGDRWVHSARLDHKGGAT